MSLSQPLPTCSQCSSQVHPGVPATTPKTPTFQISNQLAHLLFLPLIRDLLAPLATSPTLSWRRPVTLLETAAPLPPQLCVQPTSLLWWLTSPLAGALLLAVSSWEAISSRTGTSVPGHIPGACWGCLHGSHGDSWSLKSSTWWRNNRACVQGRSRTSVFRLGKMEEGPSSGAQPG